MIKEQAAPGAAAWLEEEAGALRDHFAQRPFYYAFSGVSRHFDKSLSACLGKGVTSDEWPAGLSVHGWDEFRAARVLLLLVLAEQDEEIFRDSLVALLNSADLREQVAIYSAFSLFVSAGDGDLLTSEKAQWLAELARDGLRTNIVDVYDAIALDNPFPSQAFFDEAWNQMVLKALFISRPLFRIVGLDERANLTLAEALSNLAHERWAAGRWVSPELWRPCANFLTETIVEDLGRVASTDEPGQREAAALIVAADDTGRLDGLRDLVRTFLDDVESGLLTWQGLGEQLATKSS